MGAGQCQIQRMEGKGAADSKGAEENQLAQGQRGSDLSALDIGPNLWDHEQGDEGGDQEVRGGDRLESPSS